MNDILGDPKSLIGWLCTAVMGLIMYIWRRNETEMKERLNHLEKNFATKADVETRHGENIERFDRLESKIDSGITGTHQRIDRLFDRLPERK